MIEISTAPAFGDAGADALLLPVFTDRAWGPGTAEVVAGLGDRLEAFLDGADFTGKDGQQVTVPLAGDAASVVLVGLGDEPTAESLRRAAGAAGRSLRRMTTVATTLHRVEVDDAAEAVVLGYLLGQYRFEKYRSEPKDERTEALVLVGAGDDELTAARRGEVVARAVSLARDLINEPPAGKTPSDLAAVASDIADRLEMRVVVHDEDDIAREGFGGLAAVNAGSHHPARMVELHYEPAGATAFLALVGKGIVFDSGGLSLKPANLMEDMKTDMSGGAAVIAAMQAIAELQLPVRVMAVTPLTENLPGGNAMKPGDVLTARNGKTIEVLNTDAEGRLVLADGLSLADEAEPDLIVDVATLTGACKVALGEEIAGLFSSDDETGDRVRRAAERAGERVWPLPLPADYRKKIDSDVADMKNTGPRWGGAITAALLLKEFAGKGAWAHLDIAGPARSGADDGYVTKGGTGFGVRTLVAVAEEMGQG